MHKNEQISADIVLIDSSEAKGSCYIETKNLDGETNLKYKQAVEDTADTPNGDDGILERFNSDVFLECDGPNEALYSF